MKLLAKSIGKTWKILLNKFQQNSTHRFSLNQDEFGTNCAGDKHTKISVKISVKICRSTEIPKGKLLADNIGKPIYRSVSTVNRNRDVCWALYRRLGVINRHYNQGLKASNIHTQNVKTADDEWYVEEQDIIIISMLSRLQWELKTRDQTIDFNLCYKSLCWSRNCMLI